MVKFPQTKREMMPDRNADPQERMKSTGNSKYVGKYTIFSLRDYWLLKVKMIPVIIIPTYM